MRICEGEKYFRQVILDLSDFDKKAVCTTMEIIRILCSEKIMLICKDGVSTSIAETVNEFLEHIISGEGFIKETCGRYYE